MCVTDKYLQSESIAIFAGIIDWSYSYGEHKIWHSHGDSCAWIGNDLKSSISLIHPRNNGLPSDRPILSCRKYVLCLERGLVSRSTSWLVVWTCWTVRIFFATKSRTKWISICICFILECWIGLKLSCVAPKLSHKRRGGCDRINFSSWSKDSSHTDSTVAVAKALYLASVDDHAIARCFLELQEIGVLPRNNK